MTQRCFVFRLSYHLVADSGCNYVFAQFTSYSWQTRLWIYWGQKMELINSGDHLICFILAFVFQFL